ncbi:uncharacterized protein LOC114536797 [Dendronephthya gigantea]|uniref:uncharacterized protein LOC114536797 n=1 Tax=Dendronephthya gigantea TaxID=151771 RepID=UPI0010699CD2|nr:uncharacterized protein LOC114536797 [Dendronephthya gigantea]
MFASGLLPGAAHREFLRQLRSECQDDMEYHQRLADRSEAPRRKDFNDIYSKFKKERFGTGSMSDMFSALEKRIQCLQQKNLEYSLKYQKFDEEINQPFILAIVTPLMKRVHKLVPHSKDLGFLDSSSNMEEYNLRVFVMVTHSVCGALPLGIFITSDETEQTLKDALELMKSCFDSDSAFYGAGGPGVIMTDNCSELREALKEAWPNSVLLLCIFHVLQQVWRWLHEKKNGISMEDRPSLLLLFKHGLYAESEVDLQDSFDDLISSDLASKYPNFIKYITNVFEDREAWALCYRKDLPIKGNNTNNLCEAQFLVIKDGILNRQKEVNVVGLVDKFITDLDQHYCDKVLSVSSGNYTCHQVDSNFISTLFT